MAFRGDFKEPQGKEYLGFFADGKRAMASSCQLSALDDGVLSGIGQSCLSGETVWDRRAYKGDQKLCAFYSGKNDRKEPAFLHPVSSGRTFAPLLDLLSDQELLGVYGAASILAVSGPVQCNGLSASHLAFYFPCLCVAVDFVGDKNPGSGAENFVFRA